MTTSLLPYALFVAAILLGGVTGALQLTLTRARKDREELAYERNHVCVLERQMAVLLEHRRTLEAQLGEVKADRDEWKARASRILDQVGVSSGMLTAPALQAPDAPVDSPVQRVMAALGRQELHRTASPSKPPDADSIVGVNARAAAEALGAVLTP